MVFFVQSLKTPKRRAGGFGVFHAKTVSDITLFEKISKKYPS